MRDDFSVGDDEDGEEGAILEFDDDLPFRRRQLRRVRNAIWRTLPVLLLTALLLAVAGQPDLALLLHRSQNGAPVPITVVCDVPWAAIRVDGRGPVTYCIQGIAGALPMARLRVSPGQHTLIATAEGFASYPIYIVAHTGIAGLYLTQFSLTAEGTRQALDAVNSIFADAYTQSVTLPAALWQNLGLRAAPVGATLLVRERFEAVALDSYEPFYSETTYQRPIAPEQGMIGVAVVVVEQVTIYDSCANAEAAPLLERSIPVLYATRASVTFSVGRGAPRWMATKPYALNPTADIYTAPDIAATPATPAYLLALMARATLSNWLGSHSLLAGAIAATPLLGDSSWADGAVLRLPDGAGQAPRDSADWLYIAGVLLALSPNAHKLSPKIPFAPALDLADLRATLAHPSARVCGGE